MARVGYLDYFTVFVITSLRLTLRSFTPFLGEFGSNAYTH